MKFLVVSSDVIYPVGAMTDYESNFYLPFKGVGKPIYAIPGNHDWFSALDGFAANSWSRCPPWAAMNAREALTALVTPPDRGGVESAVAEAARLRKEYGVRTAEQRAPFFEIHGREFSLIAADTGILRRRPRPGRLARGRPGAGAGALHHGDPGPSLVRRRRLSGHGRRVHRQIADETLRRHRVPPLNQCGVFAGIVMTSPFVR